MRRRYLLVLTAMSLSTLLLVACAALDGGYPLPAQHPPEADLGRTRPVCSGCHETGTKGLAFADFNHTPTFADNHRSVAGRQPQVCAMCHQQSFCNNCHSNGTELKPSLKNQTDTFQRMPHRGDYLTRHKIDGRIDPTSCYRCHGNPKTAQRCTTCHGG